MQEPGLRRLREGARIGLFKNKVGPRLFWTDFPRYFAGGGREGHGQHVGALALVPVTYDASTRATAIDSMI
jgi:hypothetical protein